MEYDGARGVAILLVFTGHLWGGVYPHDRAWLPAMSHALRGSTLAGLQLFFVLSGFLITSTLLRDSDGRGINLRRFYLRRARRLLPALVAACVIFAAWTIGTTSGPARIDRLWELPRTLTYTWDLPIFQGHTAFLSHAWSLSVEEQFYAAWPVALIVAMRLRGRRGAAAVALAGVAATVLLRAVAGLDAAEADHVLRWDALFAGCLLALCPIRLPKTAALAGWIALAALVVHPFGYVAAWVAAVVALAGSVGLGWLRQPVLVYFGRVSYGLYLWHLLVMRLGLPGPVSLVASVVAADLSWRLVERRWLLPRQLPSPLGVHRHTGEDDRPARP